MNFKVFFCVVLILMFSDLDGIAQQENDILVENILEAIAEDQGEDFDYSELTETLSHYRRHPINLNKASEEQLHELRILNPIQINNLRQHIQANGKLIDVLELQSIDGFDLETIKKLLNFSSINTPSGFENFSFKNLITKGRNDLMLRYGRRLENQAGYVSNNETGSRYLGSPDRLFLRYRFQYANNIQFSFNADKDAGEQFWLNKKPVGPDFTSASLLIKDLSSFRKIVIGDYALQFGQGLTMWSGLSFGKGADIFSIAKQDLGLRPYTSINEFSFLRGVSTDIALTKTLDFTPFFSYRKLDASEEFNQESQIAEIASLQSSGYHRTSSELGNKNRLGQMIFGGNLQYRFKTLQLGLTYYRSRYSYKFASGKHLYDKFDFDGTHLTNIGTHYSYSFKNIYFFGEFAHSLHSGLAFINGAMLSLSPKFSALVFHRNYQKNYHSYFNQAIGENSNSVNEKGFFGGLQYVSGKKYQLGLYADLFRFPWLKFGVDAPSQGHEIFSQFSYSPDKMTKFILRYKVEEKLKNAGISQAANFLEVVRKQNYRLEIQYQLSQSFKCRNRAEMVQYKTGNQANQYGYLVYQDVAYQPVNSRFTGNIRFAIFDTQDYNTRIYAYERDVLYGYSIPGFQQSGNRIYLNGRYRLKRGIDFWIKYSLTQYEDLASTGTGLELSEGAIRSEIKLQIRYQF